MYHYVNRTLIEMKKNVRKLYYLKIWNKSLQRKVCRLIQCKEKCTELKLFVAFFFNYQSFKWKGHSKSTYTRVATTLSEVKMLLTARLCFLIWSNEIATIPTARKQTGYKYKVFLKFELFPENYYFIYFHSQTIKEIDFTC